MPALVATFLAPLLPYLLKSGSRAADEAAQRFGADAYGYAKELWGKLRGKVDERPGLAEAVNDVASAPDDDRARSALEWQLDKAMRDDPRLGNELEWIVSAAQQAGVMATHGGVVVQGDVRADHGSLAAGRDINQRFNYEVDQSGLAALSRTHGTAKFLMGFGMLVSFAGFASFAYPIVRALSQGFSSPDTEPEFNFFPWLPLGFGMMFAGIVISAIGAFVRRSDS